MSAPLTGSNLNDSDFFGNSIYDAVGKLQAKEKNYKRIKLTRNKSE